MGVKFDAIKDDTIKIKEFTGLNLEDVMKRIDSYLFSHTCERMPFEPEDAPLRDTKRRVIPLGIAHSTEVIPYTGPFNSIETRVFYHVILTYKEVHDTE